MNKSIKHQANKSNNPDKSKHLIDERSVLLCRKTVSTELGLGNTSSFNCTYKLTNEFPLTVRYTSNTI